MVIPTEILGRYGGLAWESKLIQAEVASFDNQIRLLGGQLLRDSRLMPRVIFFVMDMKKPCIKQGLDEVKIDFIGFDFYVEQQS